MIPDLQDRISEIRDRWSTEISGNTLQLDDSGLSIEECSNIISDVADLREFFLGRNLIFVVEHQSGAFEYRVIWETAGTVTSTQENDSELSPDRLFGSTERASTIAKLRNNNISGEQDLQSTLINLLETESVDISFKYQVSQDHVSQFIEGQIDGVSVSYFFEVDTVMQQIHETPLSGIKNFLYANEEKRVFVIEDIDEHAYGEKIGFFSPYNLDSSAFSDFISRSSVLDGQLQKIRRECAIDYFEEMYIPPDYFEIDNNQTADYIQPYFDGIRSFQLLFCIIGVSNIARRDNDEWEVRINGRRVIESKIGLRDGERPGLFERGDETNDIEVTQEKVNAFRDLFNWIYSTRTEDRISVFRNISTIYTTSIIGILNDIQEIAKSVRTNFRYYIQDSVEEFVGIQQDVSNYVFETQQAMSDLTRDLSNNLSKDLFRVFGFTAVTTAAIISGLSEITDIRYALAVSLVPVCIYLILGLRGTYGISQQYQSIENGREKYYQMYENRIDKSVLEDIKEADASNELKHQFKIDLWIYYVLFAALAIFGILSILDLLHWQGPLTDIISSISGR